MATKTKKSTPKKASPGTSTEGGHASGLVWVRVGTAKYHKNAISPQHNSGRRVDGVREPWRTGRVVFAERSLSGERLRGDELAERFAYHYAGLPPGSFIEVEEAYAAVLCGERTHPDAPPVKEGKDPKIYALAVRREPSAQEIETAREGSSIPKPKDSR